MVIFKRIYLKWYKLKFLIICLLWNKWKNEKRKKKYFELIIIYNIKIYLRNMYVYIGCINVVKNCWMIESFRNIYKKDVVCINLVYFL